MKTIFKTVLLTFLLINLYSCTNDDSLPEEEETNLFIKAKINGVQFESNSPITLNALTEPNIITISGQNEDNTIFIQLYIKNYNGSGTYTAGQGISNENSLLITNQDGAFLTNFESGDNGIIIINENGNNLTGTFSFNGFNFQANTSIVITQGSFHATKQL
jgi:hypothetical protein